MDDSATTAPEPALLDTDTDRVPIRTALLSVSDKTGLVPFAKRLVERGVTIVSTGGTRSALTEADLPTVGIQQLTGFPEMMDGRVKTLHPRVHGGILARRDLPEHLDAMTSHGIHGIDLVCINLYPFEATVQREGVTRAEAVEQIDIGGPAMIRSAAKNHAFVVVATQQAHYDAVLDDLDDGHRSSLALRRRLAAEAFRRTADYDRAIADWFAR